MMTKIVRTLLRPFTFRGKARLLHTLSPKAGERTAKIFGRRVRLDLSDYIQRSIYLHTFEPHESSLVKNYLKRGMTFVDVGANVGYYSLLASSIVGPEGRVIAFEPSPYASNRLRETVSENGITNIEVVQAGLAEREGQIELYVGKTGRNHTPTMIPNAGGYPVTVPIQRLDDYLASHQIDRVDLMKIDVEGFEPNVIRGGKDYFKEGKIQAILCEFNKFWLEANSSSPLQLYEEITRWGYRPENMKPDFSAGVQNLLFTRQ